jgi:N4-(beta-N-acetylglucosaminyl)-L-asparaginase
MNKKGAPMHISMKRRDFLKSASLAGAAALVGERLGGLRELHAQTRTSVKPIVISSGNGLKATAKAMEMLQSGSDALDAVITGVNIDENDPTDHSVGYGGLPNEEGVVELDSSVMHGPTGRGGAVGALQNIKNPSQVARTVMERTDHVLLVGEGALKFARAHGFKEENLLTDEAREIWLKWKETLSNQDDWLPPHDINSVDIGEDLKPYVRHHGTINCNAIDLNGNISSVVTTSGMAFKIPGRVGDSPIIGAGLYVDNEVGAAGSTGRGEANLLACSSVMVVEYMRQGKSPEEACLMACKRIAHMTKERRLLDDAGRPNFQVNFYALNKKGEYGSGSIWGDVRYAVNTGQKESHLEEGAYLYKTERK